jgi:hypothetical protein
MRGSSFTVVLVAVVLLVFAASPSGAQVENQLSAYTGPNAEGYLQPLADAFGASLNSALFHSARIPEDGFRLKFSFAVMAVKFGDDDRTFSAVGEPGFQPLTDPGPYTAPTVVGDGKALIVQGMAGTQFAFPGGFNLSSFTIAVPQVRFGSVAGTDGMIRFFAIDTGDAELGDIKLFGFGLRHSISRYFEDDFPVDLAVGFFYQTFDLGDDLISSNAFSIGAQASKQFAILEPYSGLSFDTFGMDVTYDDTGGTPIDLEFDSDSSMHWTLGLAANFVVGSAFAEYSIADNNSFAFGLAFGN